MDNLCEKIRNQLADYILGILSVEEISVIDEHTGRCPNCKQDLQALEDENRILVQFGENIKEGMTGRHDKVINALGHLTPPVQREIPLLWSTIMASRIARIAAAAVIVVAVTASISLIGRLAAPAYAVEQTINAIKEIRTVHMAGEFYKQGKFECWMQFAGDPDKPTHMWLGRTDHNLCKICSPEGVFGLNKRTKAVHFAPRDERNKSWVIRFGSFFENATKKALGGNAVEIYRETSSDGRELIVVHTKSSKREQKFLVDPETKLPIGFSTINDDSPMEMMKQTLAVKSIEWIRYNQQPPEDIFAMPSDAKVVDSEVDCMVDPDSGLIADNMSRQEACLAITRQACQAMVDLDVPKLTSLTLFFRLWPPEIWETVRREKAAGRWVQGYEITGTPYQEGDIWYVPCLLKLADNKTEINTPMVKFYQMEGRTYCFTIGSKEKGVVD